MRVARKPKYFTSIKFTQLYILFYCSAAIQLGHARTHTHVRAHTRTHITGRTPLNEW